ncbi:MAG: sugar phosphate isomerase/epimerase family protein [Candidatus Bathyarchaeia archaeon]
MKRGINLWSLGWPELTRDLSDKELARRIKEIGYEGIELTFDDQEVDPVNLSESAIKKLAESFRSQGLDIPSVATGVFWKYNLGSLEEKTRLKGVQYGKAGAKMASIVGASSMLVVPGVASPDIPYEVLYENSIRSLKEIAEFAEGYGITVAVENVWNKFLYSPLEFRKFIDDVGFKNVKAYLDIANLMAIAHPENWIHTLRGLISNVHAKDFDMSIGNINGFRHMLRGDVKWSRYVQMLKDAGYDGYLILECPPDFDPSLSAPSLVDALKKAEENFEALSEITKTF